MPVTARGLKLHCAGDRRIDIFADRQGDGEMGRATPFQSCRRELGSCEGWGQGAAGLWAMSLGPVHSGCVKPRVEALGLGQKRRALRVCEIESWLSRGFFRTCCAAFVTIHVPHWTCVAM